MAIVNKRFAHLNTTSSVDANGHKILDAASAYVTGSTQLASTLHTVGIATFDNHITASQNVEISKDLHVAGKGTVQTSLKVGTDVAVAALDATFTPLLGASPTTIFDGAMVVGTDAAISGSAHVIADLSAGGNLNVGGFADVTGYAHVGGMFTASLDARVQGALFAANGNLEVQPTGLTASMDMIPSNSDQYSIGIAGKRWLGVTAQTVSASTLHAAQFDAQTISASQHLYSGGDLAVQGLMNGYSGLTVAGLASLNGGSTVNGAFTVNGGNVSISGSIGSTVLADNLTVSTPNGPLTLNGGLGVSINSGLGDVGIYSPASTVYISSSGETTLLNQTLSVIVNNNQALNLSPTKASVYADMLTVDAATGNTIVAGTFEAKGDAVMDTNLTVKGDLYVLGDRVEVQVGQLVIEDHLISVASGSTSRVLSSGAGIEVLVGGTGSNPSLTFANNLGGASGSWVSNLDLIPSLDNTYDLGINTNRWRNLSIAGALAAGSLTVTNLEVLQDAIFDVGIEVLGTGSFTGNLSTLGALEVIDSGSFGSVQVAGLTEANGGLIVSGTVEVTQGISGASALFSGNGSFGSLSSLSTVSASAGVSGSSALFDGNGWFGSLNVAGNQTVGGTLGVTGITTLAALTASGIQDNGPLTVTGLTKLTEMTASVGIFSGGPLTVQGATTLAGMTATSVSSSGNVSVAGTLLAQSAQFTGSVDITGSLTVNGVLVGGAEASVMTNANKQTLFTYALPTNTVNKFEVEVVAAGSTAGLGATWKISVGALRGSSTTITAGAAELDKEVFGASAPLLDVEVSDDGAGNLLIKADGSALSENVMWKGCVTKQLAVAKYVAP